MTPRSPLADQTPTWAGNQVDESRAGESMELAMATNTYP
jgi:hypothetical protein